MGSDTLESLAQKGTGHGNKLWEKFNSGLQAAEMRTLAEHLTRSSSTVQNISVFYYCPSSGRGP